METRDWIALAFELWIAIIATLEYIEHRRENKKTAQRRPTKHKRKR